MIFNLIERFPFFPLKYFHYVPADKIVILRPFIYILSKKNSIFWGPRIRSPFLLGVSGVLAEWTAAGEPPLRCWDCCFCCCCCCWSSTSRITFKSAVNQDPSSGGGGGGSDGSADTRAAPGESDMSAATAGAIATTATALWGAHWPRCSSPGKTQILSYLLKGPANTHAYTHTHTGAYTVTARSCTFKFVFYIFT